MSVALDSALDFRAESHADEKLDRDILRGISGSFLISVLSIPFGYLTSLTLAHISPEAVGLYSIIGIYLGIVSGILYLGGATVTVRYMAELLGWQRPRFLVSTFLLAMGTLALLLAVLVIFPEVVRFVFGPYVDPVLCLFLFAVAPVPLLYFFALAALKGLLKVTLSQVLTRGVTVGVCLIYGYFFLAHREAFLENTAYVLFLPYFALLAVLAAVALRRLRKEIGPLFSGWQWFLPAGFWPYAMGVQGASMLNLLHVKIDQILVLRQFSLSELGIYFVILQLSETFLLLVSFYLSGVFPGFTKLVALSRWDKLNALYLKVARQLILMGSGITVVFLLFAKPILALFGDRYLEATGIFIVLVTFLGIDSLTVVNGNLMTACRRPNYWILVQLLRVISFVSLFVWLTQSYGLMGAALARGISSMLAQALSMWIVATRLPVAPRIPYQFWLSVGLIIGVGSVAHLELLNTPWELIAMFLVSGWLFLRLGRYRMADVWVLASPRRNK